MKFNLKHHNYNYGSKINLSLSILFCPSQIPTFLARTAPLNLVTHCAGSIQRKEDKSRNSGIWTTVRPLHFTILQRQPNNTYLPTCQTSLLRFADSDLFLFLEYPSPPRPRKKKRKNTYPACIFFFLF